MSESRFLRGLRGGQRERVPRPAKTGLECPVCGGRTVNRDVSPADSYYVEYCYGGVIKMFDEEAKEVVEFECPYYDAGWEK